jgi:hypothetical protein
MLEFYAPAPVIASGCRRTEFITFVALSSVRFATLALSTMNIASREALAPDYHGIVSLAIKD